MKFTERELQLLRLAMHMADEEGGWEYPDLEWKEVEKLYEKIGGKVNGTQLQYPSLK